MKIKIEVTKIVEEKLNLKDIIVIRTRDVCSNSFKIEIFYKGVEIGSGRYNFMTRWAHIYIETEAMSEWDKSLLEDVLTTRIENGTQPIN